MASETPTLQFRGDRRAMRGGNRKRAKRACGRALELLVRRHESRQIGRLLERYRSRFAVLSDVDNEQSCAVGIAHIACHVMYRARGFPPTLPNLVGLQWTCVKLILNCTFNDVCEHRNVVTMDWSCGPRPELDHDSLNVAEISSREHLLQQLGTCDRTRRGGLLCESYIDCAHESGCEGDCVK